MKRFTAISVLLLMINVCSYAVGMRKDIMDRAFISPERIVWTSGSVSDSDILLVEGNGQSDVAQHKYCTLLSSGNDTASVLLDFGKELHGGLKMVMGGGRPRLVRIRFGESVSETCSEPVDTAWVMGHSTNDHAMRDFVITIPRDGSIELGNTGFRFVRIDLLDKDAVLNLREVTAILRYRDIPQVGSFRCSDERLNEIWQTGAWTVHLNMQEYIWDGIKRDRLIWLGDMHPEMAAVMAVFGYNDVIDRSIDLACEQYPLPNWLNGMSAYSMWYLIIMHDWYMHNGNRAYLAKHRDYITGLIDRIDECVEEDGSEHLADWRFLDWPSSPNVDGVSAGYRALLSLALKRGAVLCDILGEEGVRCKCREIQKRLEKKVLPHNGLKQAAALMAMAGMMPAETACNEVISVGGAKGFSTFYGYYMLEALAAAGQYQTALDIIREFWGGMLDLGATTFWEDFNLDWAKNAARIDEFTPEGKTDIHRDFGDYCYKSYRHSLCHGWASGPTPWMTRHVLGVEILEPGCRKIKVQPHLGDLKWAEGTFPTPLGPVLVKVRRTSEGKIVTDVQAPEGVTVIK
ncbi:MAG: alpha-L-rhamnosidase [Alistipes sp.]|nr:alpha-L-rhamnosidase [Candidatus Minthomonas equi]